MKRNSGALWVAAGVGTGLAVAKLLQPSRHADLRGEVVLITGGSRGLGLLLAREFAQQSCRVAICARNEDELERARKDLAVRGASALVLVADVTDPEAASRVIAEVTRHFGRIDVLVNNAGTIQVGPVNTLTRKDFEHGMDVIFWGALNFTLAVLPQMRKRGAGRIVNITSIGGKVSIPHMLPYNCAKFAAVALSEGLRAELAASGIRVTTIAPGLMRTGSHLNAQFKGRPEREAAWFSLGASLPFVSMNAERAARQIVAAVRRGQAERILTVPAQVLACFHGVFPGITADLLGSVSRLVLPAAGDDETGQRRGSEIDELKRSWLLRWLTSLGEQAAASYNQYA